MLDFQGQVYANQAKSVLSPHSNKNVTNLPYNDLKRMNRVRMKNFHERKSSNLTLPKNDTSEDFTNHMNYHARVLQSEQKMRRNVDYRLKAHKLQYSDRQDYKIAKHKKKLHPGSDIEIGGKDLHIVDHSLPHMNKNGSSKEFNINIRKRNIKTKRTKDGKLKVSEHLKLSKSVNRDAKVSPYEGSSLQNSQEVIFNSRNKAREFKPKIDIGSFEAPTKKQKAQNMNSLTESLPSINGSNQLLLPYLSKSKPGSRYQGVSLPILFEF